MKLIYPIGIICLLVSCQQKEVKEDTAQLGVLQHHFTISEPSRKAFDRGLLLLHSFEYDDALEAFKEARSADTTEVMAYWGETMSHYKALWGQQDVPAGRAILAALGSSKEERLLKVENEMEGDFLEAAEILYGEGELEERNKAYAHHMETLYKKYPGDQEVAAFYSLGLMWAAQGDEKQAFLDKSSEVAAGIMKENPTHPGALHYMIHANDDPEYAEMAKIAADKYAKVAPDATHALHMPSHIYVALGMWNEVVTSNVASYAASLNRMERKGLNGKARGYHSMAWLHYGYLQQGQYDKAELLMKEMIGYFSDSTGSESYLVRMQNEQRIESGKWLDDVEPLDVNYNNLGLTEKSAKHFFRSLLAYDKEDVATIKNEIDTLQMHLAAAELIVSDDGIVLCSAGPTRYAPNKEDVKRTNVVIHQMQALIALLNKDEKSAEAHLIEATKLENESGYDSGPPFIAYPSYEQYGDWLLTKNRAEDALVQFNRSLEKRTNRSKALRGKIEALKKLNRMEEADAVQEILDVFWKWELVAMQ
jgi:tetratricopeptide (TPR) repeat protein